MKIRAVRAELFDAEGWTKRTDMNKLTVTYRNFANKPKMFVELG